MGDLGAPNKVSNSNFCTSYEKQIASLHIKHNMTFEDFENLQFLADGGMSRVFTATLQTVPVVIKWVYPEIREGCTEALEKEKEFLSQINHPNIIKLLGSGYHQNLPFIVVEKLIGTDLAAVLSCMKKKKQDASNNESTMFKRLEWALQIAYAMKYLHFDALDQGRGLIHRDLKSNNIGMGYDGKIRVLDFGIATQYDYSHHTDLKPFKMTTKVGTRTYCAPEVCRSQIYNEKCDVYSFGILLWEIVTGRFPLNSVGDAFYRLIGCSLNRRPRLNKKWDPKLQSLMVKCWDENPVNRPDFMTVCSDLISILSDYATIITSKHPFRNLDVKEIHPPAVPSIRPVTRPSIRRPARV